MNFYLDVSEARKKEEDLLEVTAIRIIPFLSGYGISAVLLMGRLAERALVWGAFLHVVNQMKIGSINHVWDDRSKLSRWIRTEGALSIPSFTKLCPNLGADHGLTASSLKVTEDWLLPDLRIHCLLVCSYQKHAQPVRLA